MKQAIIYTRFSPRPVKKKKFGKNVVVVPCMSCEFQEQKCRDYCDLHGMDILAAYQDKMMSGARADNRPGLNQALVHVCKVKGVLVVYALARLARSTKDAIMLSETLAKQQADLAIVTQSVDTSTAMGRAFFKIMAVIAELERETTGERTKAKLAQMRIDGLRTSGQISYGYKVDPNDEARVIKDDHEQTVLGLMLRFHKNGYNAPWICRELTRLGLKPRAKAWYPMTVMRIIEYNKE